MALLWLLRYSKVYHCIAALVFKWLKLVNVHSMVINKYQNKHISPLTALKLRHVIHPVQDLNRSQ